MGFLENGKWIKNITHKNDKKGAFIRKESQFRNWVTKSGQAGPSGSSGFKAEQNRYHLYISLACPWAHRTLIFYHLKNLKNIVSISSVHWYLSENGWTFMKDANLVDDPINKSIYLYEIYVKSITNYSGRVTVPVLWDKQTNSIVSNESSEIIRMFNSEFDEVGANTMNFYPKHLKTKINEINDKVYKNVNNGVYKVGFATSQNAYEKAIKPLFNTLNYIEDILGKQKYLAGDILTEADWRLFTTLIRFDAVYVGHFKCNKKRICDYTNIFNYLCELYQYPGIAKTVNMNHIKYHYYLSHKHINPNGIVPSGPKFDYMIPHNRNKF